MAGHEVRFLALTVLGFYAMLGWEIFRIAQRDPFTQGLLQFYLYSILFLVPLYVVLSRFESKRYLLVTDQAVIVGTHKRCRRFIPAVVTSRYKGNKLLREELTLISHEGKPLPLLVEKPTELAALLRETFLSSIAPEPKPGRWWTQR